MYVIFPELLWEILAASFILRKVAWYSMIFYPIGQFAKNKCFNRRIMMTMQEDKRK